MAYLTTYLPNTILSYVQDHEKEFENLSPPMQHSYESVVLFADVSGYTAMCEAMSHTGPGGEQHLAKNLNSYFELLVRAIASQGGDVFKYAGDAVIVVWPPSDEDLPTLVRRAVQCGLEIRNSMQDAVLSHGVRLSVKVGIGAGEVTILHLGGVYSRLEYLPIGEPLVQAFNAEHKATKTELVVSPYAWGMVEKYFEADIQPENYAFVNKCIEPLRKVSVFKASQNRNNLSDTVLNNIKRYIPTSIIPFATQNDDKWINELRRITCLFVNLGMTEEELVRISRTKDAHRVHSVLKAVQLAVYKFEGSLNKFLMDDKGSTLVAVFGLPPLAHENDATRGVLAALHIQEALAQLDLRASIGITTGNAFCGVVGNRGRREYSVLGDTVNLSARLMQHASASGAGVLCETNTQRACAALTSHEHKLSFYEIATISVKGKSVPIPIWKPVLKECPPNAVHTDLHRVVLADTTKDDFGGDVEMVRCRNLLCKMIDSRLPAGCGGATAFAVKAKAGGGPGPGGAAPPPLPRLPQAGAGQGQDKASGVCAVLHAEAGMGKTKVLSATLHRYLAKGLCEVVFGAGSAYAYSRNTPVRAWKGVLECMLDKGGIQNARSFARAALGAVGPGLLNKAACLNEALEWDFEETAATLALTKEARLEALLDLIPIVLAALIRRTCQAQKKAGVVVVMEDAVFLDPMAWRLCTRAVRSIKGLILIVATRPLDKTNLGAFGSKDVAAAYTELLELPNATLITINARPDNTIYKLAAQALKTPTKKFIFPKGLVQLITDKARGNPLYARELMMSLQAQALVTVESDGKVTVARDLLASGPNKKQQLAQRQLDPRKYLTPLPAAIDASMGSQVDRLTDSQSHSLKVAAVLGNEFSRSILKKCYVLEIAESTLDEELQEMVDLNVFHADSDDEEQDTYYFTNGCMRDLVLSRMLEVHQQQLIAKIRLNSELFQAQEEIANSTSGGGGDHGSKAFQDSLLEGHLKKQGGRIKTWKSRYFVLFRDKLLYYKGADTVDQSPKGEIPITYETLVEGDLTGDGSNFLLAPMAHTGKDRKYELVAKDKEDAQRWIDAIGKLTTKLKDSEKKDKARGKSCKDSIVGVRFSQIADALQRPSGLMKKAFFESVKEGFLMKSGGAIKTWKKRYFILFHDKLIYYNTSQTLALRNVKGVIALGAQTVCETTADLPASFTICSELGGRKYVVTAYDEKECSEWLEAIRGVTQQQGDEADATNQKMANHSVLEGYLRKKGGTLGNWSTRYFVLFNDKLQYFAEKNKKMTGEFSVCPDTVVTRPEDDKSTLMVQPDAKSKAYVLGAKDEAEANKWSNAIIAQTKLR